MKNKKYIFVSVLASIAVLSGTFAASADSTVDMKKLKRCLILDAPPWYNVNDYNVNNDNTVNVLDLCRAKSSLLSVKDEKQNIVLACSEPSVNSSNSVITVPVYISGNTKGVSALQFKAEYDSRYFQLSDAYAFDLGGTVSFSDSGIVQYVSDFNENVTDAGNILYLEFRAAESVPYGAYNFSLSAVQASYTDPVSGTAQEVAADECAQVSQTLRVNFFREGVTTTVTTTTPPPETTVTSPSETTTVSTTVTKVTKPPVTENKLNFRLQDAEITQNGNRLRIPVYMSKNTRGISMLSMNVEYDADMFSIAGVSAGSFGGYGYGTGNNNLVFAAQNSQNITSDEGIIAYIEFDIRSRERSGTYNFRLKEIKPSYSENWNQKQLPANEYKADTERYTYEYRGTEITTVTTTTTTPVPTTVTTTTTTPVPTTVTTTTTTPVPTTVTTTTTTPVPTTVTTTTTTPVPTTVTTTTTPAPATTPGVDYEGGVPAADKQWFINQVNSYRAQNGLSNMTLDMNACRAADERAEQLSVSFQNNQPDGKSVLLLLYRYNVYPYNFSQSKDNSSTSVESLYSSYVSKAAGVLLDKNYKKIGIGRYTTPSGQMYWSVFTFS